jgi:hypothetical protein
VGQGEETIRELSEISQILGVSETEVISRAIHNFYIKLKKEEQISEQGNSVLFRILQGPRTATR